MNNKMFFAALLLTLSVVLACGNGGESGKAETAGEMKTKDMIPSVPVAPTGVAAVSGSDRITVKWQPSQGATSYNLFYTDKPGGAKTQGVKITGLTGTPYEHTGIKQRTMYYYVVTASNEGGESQASAESGAMAQDVALQAPVNVAASGGDGKITVKWNTVPGASSYSLYYATKPGIARAKGKRINGVMSAPYQLIDVKKKTMYFFAVTAVNDAGESPASNETGAMP